MEKFNPLALPVVAESVERRLMREDPVPLSQFYGRPFTTYGIYGLYFDGVQDLYSPLSGTDIPIYVGMASVYTTRKGTEENGAGLYTRLRKHRGSIVAADNLDLADFRVRYLSVEDAFIPMSEALMLRKYQPVWNFVVDGFGMNGPGDKGRGSQQRSRWDTLHPGRTFAKRLPPHEIETPQTIHAAVVDHLATFEIDPLPDSIEMPLGLPELGIEAEA